MFLMLDIKVDVKSHVQQWDDKDVQTNGESAVDGNWVDQDAQDSQRDKIYS